MNTEPERHKMFNKGLQLLFPLDNLSFKRYIFLWGHKESNTTEHMAHIFIWMTNKPQKTQFDFIQIRITIFTKSHLPESV